MSWFEELGFSENPFNPDPDFSAKYSAGLERELQELEYHVSSGSFAFVEGPSGSGKSVLLKLLLKRLGGKAVFVNALDGIDVRSIVRKKTSVISSFLGKPVKNLVVLVDHAEALATGPTELIKYYYDNNIFSSVVLAGVSLRSAGLPPSITDRIGSRVIKLRALSEDDALLIARRRLGSSDVLPDEAIRKAYNKSGGNAKKFLELCEKEAAAAKPVAVTEKAE